MRMPTDMHKWSAKFTWQMIGFMILLLLMALGMLSDIWFSRVKWLANPTKLFVPTAEVAFAAVLCVCLAFFCLGLSIRTRNHDAKMREMEKNRPPLTLSKLREELQPEKQEQFRTSMLRLLRTMPPDARAYAEANMKQLVDRYRADLGSTPEVEGELAKLEAFNREVLEELKTLN